MCVYVWWWWGVKTTPILKEAMHAYYYNYCGKCSSPTSESGFYVNILYRTTMLRTVGACAQRVASIPQTTELELETHFVERWV